MLFINYMTVDINVVNCMIGCGICITDSGVMILTVQSK